MTSVSVRGRIRPGPGTAREDQARSRDGERGADWVISPLASHVSSEAIKVRASGREGKLQAWNCLTGP